MTNPVVDLADSIEREANGVEARIDDLVGERQFVDYAAELVCCELTLRVVIPIDPEEVR